ncbi:MAG TPA: hypothetical protein PKD52_04775 [Clostridiales bacterium]|nr:hypothetical protein [Clostridiales bacterium]
MEYLTPLIQAVIQWLPFGHWLTETPYGVVYGALLINVFSVVILFLSKLIFKEYFSGTGRKVVILGFLAGTSLIVAGCYVYVTLKTLPLMYGDDFTMLDFSNLYFYYDLAILISYLFFIGYLIDFIIRLIRRGRTKKTETMSVS